MNKIPNVFHFIFGLKKQTEAFHLAFFLCIKSCAEINKPEKIYLHYRNLPYGPWWDEALPYLTLNKIEDRYFTDNFIYNDKLIETFRYAHIADVLRLQVLKEYGGIYADIDTIFVNPLPAEFFEKSFIMGKEKVDYSQTAAVKAGGSLCNAWIASEKNAPFCELWLNNIYQAFDGSWSAHSTFLPFQLSKRCPELIWIEPERSFYYFDWTKKRINEIFTTRETDFKGIYSIHLWGHLWWDYKRNAFGAFNNKKLTYRFVKFSGTTYSFIARPFLPPHKNVPGGRVGFFAEKYLLFFSEFRDKLYDKAVALIKRK